MKKLVAITFACGTIVAAVLSRAEARLPYAQKEKKACVICHVKPTGGKVLNATGKYYKSHGHSLKGYKQSKGSARARK